METPLHLHTSQPKQPQTIINRVHTLIHLTALLALFYYRFSSLTNLTGFLPVFSWLFISFCELVHSFLWVLGQSSRWRPISREVYPERLPGDKELPPIDVFICTADPKKEPTIGVMNTVISAMCLDYPADKLCVYVSDDAGAPITLYGMKEAYKFAKEWIPFCNKYGITTRAPDAYFSASEEKNSFSSDEFVENRKEMEMRYSLFKQRVESAGDIGDETLSSAQDHPPLVEVIRDDDVDKIVKRQVNMPNLIYVTREKRRSHPHHFKAGALNVLLRVSGIITNSPYILFLDCDMYCNDPSTARQAMCFHIDPHISSSLAFVQFPQLFHNVSKNDIYNDLLRVIFKVQCFGVDGINGPGLSGTCLYMKREALFKSPIEKDINLIINTQYIGSSNVLITSLQDNKFKQIDNNEDASEKVLGEARFLASCTYEQHTQWGVKVGFMYYSVVEDYLTGLVLHSKGWKSVYRYSRIPAFLGSVTTNLYDTLVQTTRWNSGLLEVGFSRFCPLIYGSRLSLPNRMFYASFVFQSLSSLPMTCYALVPQLCFFSGISLYPKVLSSGGSLRLSWNHQRILIIKSVTSYFIACLDFMKKLVGKKEITFSLTNKVVDEKQVERYRMDMFDFQAPIGLLLPLTLIVSLNIACFLLGLVRLIIQKAYEDVFGQIFLSLFIIVINHPIIEGMRIRKDKGRIPTSVTIISGAFFISLVSYVLFQNI